MTQANETGALAPLFLTKRLALRAPRVADAPRAALLLGDGEAAKTLARIPHPYTEDDAASFLAATAVAGAAGRTHHFAIEARGSSDGMIGFISLEPDDGGAPSLGYWIGPPYWGRGFGGEAAAAILLIARDALRLPRIVSGYFAHNIASARIQERLGFRVVGEDERTCRATGLAHRHVHTALDLRNAA